MIHVAESNYTHVAISVVNPHCPRLHKFCRDPTTFSPCAIDTHEVFVTLRVVFWYCRSCLLLCWRDISPASQYPPGAIYATIKRARISPSNFYRFSEGTVVRPFRRRFTRCRSGIAICTILHRAVRREWTKGRGSRYNFGKFNFARSARTFGKRRRESEREGEKRCASRRSPRSICWIRLSDTRVIIVYPARSLVAESARLRVRSAELNRFRSRGITLMPPIFTWKLVSPFLFLAAFYQSARLMPREREARRSLLLVARPLCVIRRRACSAFLTKSCAPRRRGRC